MSYSLYPLKLFIKKKTIVMALLISLAINGFTWIWFVVGTTQRGEEAVLHYSILFQIDRLGSFSMLYLVPGIGLAIILCNFIAAWLLYSYDTVIAKLIAVSTVILQILLLTAASILVFLNS